jgi:choline dehydrogenase-like flavoprotein
MTPYYNKEIPYDVVGQSHGPTIGGYACVGGPSVFYGCVAFRFRARDFEGDPGVVAGSGAAWPFRYDELEPYYAEAERLLAIAGDDAGDPTAPPRSAGFPQPPAPLAPVSERLARAAVGLGLSPFHLPLAINHAAGAGRNACVACRTCDTYACAIEAKNDVATMLIKPLVARGLTLLTDTVVTRLEADGACVTGVHVWRKDAQRAEVIAADRVLLAAGAIGTPHLILASGLDARSPARAAVGRYLMRHANAMVFGFYPSRPDPEHRFHKQLALNDWYFGDPGADDCEGLTKLGGVQQMMTPPRALVAAHLPRGTRALAALTEQLTGLLCIAEDQPRADNGVTIDPARRDAFGLPRLTIRHAYSGRDEQAVRALIVRAKRVLAATGALFAHTHRVKTFSHAVGTVRMGDDPHAAPLDATNAFRGLDNLYVVDGSALPTSAGVNPSLTIAAVALRAAAAIVRA